MKIWVWNWSEVRVKDEALEVILIKVVVKDTRKDERLHKNKTEEEVELGAAKELSLFVCLFIFMGVTKRKGICKNMYVHTFILNLG